MKNFRKFILSTKPNNPRLFIPLTIVALFAIASLLIWQQSAQMQEKNNNENPSGERFSINGIQPTLGNYPNTTVIVGSNTTITPDAAPTNTANINVSTNSSFKGLLAANSITGVIRITNAHPAGTYLVTVKAFNSGGMTTRTFTLTVVSGTICNGTVNFTNAADVSLETFTNGLAVGDFNNDGNQDIASVGGFTGVASIRLGNGTGGFSGTTTVSVDDAPRSIAIGDFNNDGNQDFAAASQSTNTISIRLGDGAGNFSGTTNVSVGSGPLSVAIGDFNNDGNQDFAAANQSSNTVSIRLGDGAGNFSGTTNVSVGSSPLSVAIGDFNNDGNQDFATANQGGLTGIVSIRLGNGLGSFSNGADVSVGNTPRRVAIGDFNNDGNQDLAVANINGGTVSIRLGNGTGNFSGTTNVSVGSNPSTIAIGDFNNDGNQDFAAGNASGTIGVTVSIRLGNGLGNFISSTNVSAGADTGIVIGDFNNDGTQDFAATSSSFPTSTVSIRLGGCVTMPTPTPTPTSTPTPMATPTPTATPTPSTTPSPSPSPSPTPGGNFCVPTTTVTEGDLFPGGIVSFGVTSGQNSVTVDHVNAGTGLQSLTVVGTPTNATVNIPAFTPSTFNPVVVTFTPTTPGLAVDFTLRAASTFHAAFIRVRCAETCTPTTTVTEGNLFPGGIVSFGVMSGAGSVTIDHVNAGTGLQSLTIVGTPINAVVNIPAFAPGTFNPVVVTFSVIDPTQPVDFTLRAASTFHAANIRVRCPVAPQ